jgi:hypothetical protein
LLLTVSAQRAHASDAERQPGHTRRHSAEHVAQIMSAEIDTAEPDE